MKPTVAVIAAGAMGSGVAGRLTQNAIAVTTSLAGRSPASAARAQAAGMRPVSDAEIADADIILSIVPPGEALALAARLAPHLAAAARKPLYVDCNAVNPQTVARIAAVIEATGARFVDGGIIGGPPAPGTTGTSIYVSGPHAPELAVLINHGLEIRVLPSAIGAASALKMSYAGITKGFTALGAAMMLAATRGGAADDLRAELAASQPALFGWLSRQLPRMYSKAYRWVAEMEEIAGFNEDDPAARQIFLGAAGLYQRLAEDFADGKKEIGALDDFLKPRKQ
jgi:putative dehydrogenase